MTAMDDLERLIRQAHRRDQFDPTRDCIICGRADAYPSCVDRCLPMANTPTGILPSATIAHGTWQ